MSDMNLDRAVTHDEAGSRFVITDGGAEAGFAAYEERVGVRTFNHTVVYPEFQGRGLSKPLIKGALDATRAQGMKIRPECSAVAGFVAKNDEYRDLVA